MDRRDSDTNAWRLANGCVARWISPSPYSSRLPHLHQLVAALEAAGLDAEGAVGVVKLAASADDARRERAAAAAVHDHLLAWLQRCLRVLRKPLVALCGQQRDS